ncbi:MAG: glycerate kinase [Planctomycetaceae bacterium]
MKNARNNAIRIWRAGVDAVRSERLVSDAVQLKDQKLFVQGRCFPLPRQGRLVVVGAGKAGAGMAVGLETALASWPATIPRCGWVNVPADCVQPTDWIQLHPARPPGINSPTPEAVAGTQHVLDLASNLDPQDLCLVLISGGGSALLTAPVEGLSLADKQQVTRWLSEHGATIEELNCVRRSLSRIKGGGLLRACSAGTIVPLVISDVIGDPLATIASGPLIPNPTTAVDALIVLQRFAPDHSSVPETVWRVLERRAVALSTKASLRSSGSQPGSKAWSESPRTEPEHFIIGNNRTACEAAAEEAERCGYEVVAIRPDERGIAREVGVQFLQELKRLREDSVASRPCCLITGGEPVVELARTDQHRRGGRNQELVLAALCAAWDVGLDRITLLSGGTDGEDGPTDAAGAVVDSEILLRARDQGLNPNCFLAINNSFSFWEQVGGLLRTGPTQTNVMDLRVGLVAR